MTEETSKRLSGRRILITGAASGMGRSIAHCFQLHGARLALIDRSADELRAVASVLNAVGFAIDVASETDVTQAVAAAVGHLGGLDGIVNAAGVYSAASLADTSYELWRTFIDVNLTGPYLICRSAMPHIDAAGGGTVVNVSSMGAILPSANQSAYVASKGGLTAFTKSLAAEFGDRNIRANVICPGMVHSGITHAIYEPEAAERVAASRTSLSRMGQPEEIALAALFLSSADSSYVTGSTLTVDGGWSYY